MTKTVMNLYLRGVVNIKEFINAFKNTSYYKELFNVSTEILGIFLLGSRAVGITDEHSDYDIVILTLDGDYIDASKYEYLKYGEQKVHWYYQPINKLFQKNFDDNQLMMLCPIQLKHLSSSLTIYENPKYTELLSRLYTIKDKISTIGIYQLFDKKQNYIEDILCKEEVLETAYSKFLYHLCLASYYLLGESPNKTFLKTLKRIKWVPVPNEYKELAIQRLKLSKAYIEKYPLDIDLELAKLQNLLNIQN